jgi:hypothetical protein
MYTSTTKEVINKSINTLVIDLLSSQTPFSMIISGRNWESPLPKNLMVQPYFFIQIKEKTLEDSSYDVDSGNLIINTEFNSVPNQLILYPEDVRGIFDVTMQTPIINKPYEEAPKFINIEKAVKLQMNPLANFSVDELTPEVHNSIDHFVKNNPKLFNTTPKEE